MIILFYKFGVVDFKMIVMNIIILERYFNVSLNSGDKYLEIFF